MILDCVKLTINHHIKVRLTYYPLTPRQRDLKKLAHLLVDRWNSKSEDENSELETLETVQIQNSLLAEFFLTQGKLVSVSLFDSDPLLTEGNHLQY